jgi:hypothetical protein
MSRAARGASKQTIAEARRLCATIQLELKARTFDYAKRFPNSGRIKQRGIETPEKIRPISVTELADRCPPSAHPARNRHRSGLVNNDSDRKKPIKLADDAVHCEPLSALKIP